VAGAIPDIIIRLVADVDDFIRDWDRAADAAERAAARIRAAGAAAGNGPDADSSRRFNDLNAELERMTRAARRAADSIRDLGNENRRAGESVEEFRRRLDQMRGSLGSLGSSIRGVPMPILIAAIAIIASLLPGIIAGFLALAAAAGGVAIAIGVMMLGAKGLGQAFDGLERTIQPLKRQLDSVFRAELSQEMIKLGQTITTQLTPAFKQIAHAVSDVIKETTQWIRSSEGMQTIKTALGGVTDLIRELGPAVKGVAQIFTEWMAAVAPSMAKIGRAISEVVIQFRDMFREAQKSGQLTRIFEAGAEAIKGFGAILKGLVAILLEVADKGGMPAASAMQKLGKALEDAAPFIGQCFKALAMMGDVLFTVIGAISTAVGWIAKMAEGMNDIDAQSKGIKDFFKSIPALAGAAGDAIMKFFKYLQDNFAVIDLNDFGPWMNKVNQNIKQGTMKAQIAIGQWVTKMGTDIKQGVDKANQAIKQGFDKVGQDVAKGLAKAGQEVVKWTTKLVSDTKSGIDKTNQAIKQGFDKSVQVVKQAVDKMVQDAQAWWDKMVAAVKEGLDKANSEIKAGLDRAVGAIKGMIDQFVAAGAEMVMGLVKGAKSKVDELVNIFKAMAAAALAGAKAVLGIHSPSKVFADEVGVHIPAGIAAGIKAGTPALNAALAASMRTLPMTANVALSGAAGRGAAIGLGAGTGKQVIEVKLDTGSGGDGALGTLIGGLARRGQLKITANAVVGGRK
jgi:hypothetical protein